MGFPNCFRGHPSGTENYCVHLRSQISNSDETRIESQSRSFRADPVALGAMHVIGEDGLGP